jgi:ABC-type lipoprotein export system ATPase subunit
MHPVSLHQVGKTYRLGSVDVPALSDITLDIHQGAFTVLSGPSGSGKTTLLNLIGCIDMPDQGRDHGGRATGAVHARRCLVGLSAPATSASSSRTST